eukprot:s3772_g4.t1
MPHGPKTRKCRERDAARMAARVQQRNVRLQHGLDPRIPRVLQPEMLLPGSSGEPHAVSGAGRAISEGCGAREGDDGDLELGEAESENSWSFEEQRWHWYQMRQKASCDIGLGRRGEQKVTSDEFDAWSDETEEFVHDQAVYDSILARSAQAAGVTLDGSKREPLSVADLLGTDGIGFRFTAFSDVQEGLSYTMPPETSGDCSAFNRCQRLRDDQILQGVQAVMALFGELAGAPADCIWPLCGMCLYFGLAHPTGVHFICWRSWSQGLCSRRQGGQHARRARLQDLCSHRHVTRAAGEFETINMMKTEIAKAWPGGRYDLIHCNCIHFCEELAKRLGARPVPSWVRGLHETGAAAASVFRTFSQLNVLNLVTGGPGGAVPNGWKTNPPAVADSPSEEAQSLQKAMPSQVEVIIKTEAPGRMF